MEVDDLVLREANDIVDVDEVVGREEDVDDGVVEDAIDVESSVDVSEVSAVSVERISLVTAGLARVVGCRYILDAGDTVTGAWVVACVSSTDA